MDSRCEGSQICLPALDVSLHVGAIEEDDEGGGYRVYVQRFRLPAGDYEGPLHAGTLQAAMDLLVTRFALPGP
jgi:hypothetical protein